ncbi:MAG: leucine-rich repeat domain-containing protein [Dysgonamonadaceae bacterium]|nr:leucine-rich repeat domain-containing protein [Dysgonamonadaceae bacterium]
MACGKDEPDPSITASVQSITLPPAGGEQTFTVTIANANEWTLTPSPQSWLSVSTQGGNQVKVKSDANLDVARSAVVTCTVQGTDIAVSIPVTQSAISVTASAQNITLPSMGGAQTFTITCNADDWIVVSPQSWLSVSRQGGNQVTVQSEVNFDNARSTAVKCQLNGKDILSVQVSQNAVTKLQSDSLALADLYHTAGGSGWTTKWTLTSGNIAQWKGVTVTDERVSGLELPSNNLVGNILASFGRLTNLAHCNLSGNKLSGSIPTEISNLTKLEYLDLSGNNLSGIIPALNIAKLVVLDLSGNEFTDMAAQTLSDLEYLALRQNKLQGSLPSSWANYKKLIYIDVSANAYTGSIPNWTALIRLRALHLYDNKLSGGLPTLLATLNYLESIALHKNDFTGNIPSNLGDLPLLESLWLSQNRLTGEIPQSLLQNPHWDEWKGNVAPQQSDYGFSNYVETRAVQANTPSELSDYGKQLKKTIRQRLGNK